MPAAPRMSLVFAARDRPVQCALCLETLRLQTDADFEVVLVDDASLAPTAALLRGLRLPQPVTVVRREVSTGRAAARNAGWRAASGDVVVFLDADILAFPTLVAGHRAAHADPADGGPLVCSGFPWSWRAVETAAFPAERPLLGPSDLPALLARHAPSGPAWDVPDEAAPFLWFVTRDVSVRREVLASCGGFWEGFRRYGLADWELGYRLHRQGARFRAEPAAACLHQRHPAGPGRDRDNARNYALFLERHPDAEVGLMAREPPWRDQGAYARLRAALLRLRATAPGWAAALEPDVVGRARRWAAARAGRPAAGTGAAAPWPPAVAGRPVEVAAAYRAARDPRVAPLLAALANPAW